MGLCARIGIDGRLVYQKEGCGKEITESPMPTHKEAIQMVLHALVNEKTGAVKDLSEIEAIGHRIVHGGEKFESSVIINEEMIEAVNECTELAPHRHSGMPGADARRTHGSSIRYRFPSDHAAQGIYVRPAL